jgi:hypothetical protein
MAIENLRDRGGRPTQPYDTGDLPRFGQLTETVKDVFAKELREFFSYNTSDVSDKIGMAYNIEKYSFDTAGSFEGDYGTIVDLIMSHGDVVNKFPLVSITSSKLSENKLSIGNNLAQIIKPAPSVTGRNAGPFSVPENGTIQFTIIPNDDISRSTQSVITFTSYQFPDLNNILIDDVISIVNNTQALIYTLEKDANGHLVILAGGKILDSDNCRIEITGGNCLNAFGFVVGDRGDYDSQSNLPINRYYVSANMTINIDVIGDSQNTKQELSDLIFSFFSFYMEKRQFQFFGRSYFDRNLLDEWFHIILLNKFSWSSEIAKPRPGKEGYSYIYAVRGSVPITVVDFIDKVVPYSDYMVDNSYIADEFIPDGDYFRFRP